MHRIVRLALPLFAVAAWLGTAAAEPVKIRVGRGSAAEEQLWLMAAKPELARSQGAAYKLELTNFPATDNASWHSRRASSTSPPAAPTR